MSEIVIPKAYEFLFEPARYKVAKGGRGGAKSESFARALLAKGAEEKCNILCAREFQNSIKESVHGLLESIILNDPVLRNFYDVLNSEIRGKNGTQFIFSGLRNKILSIKSIHNVKYCWVEEAETVSDYSWKILIPSIRAEDSEIWVSYNPELEDSATNQRFVYHKPKEAVVKHINYDQNPFFPEVLRKEMEELKERNYAEYLHIWVGHCKQAVEGAVFANELEKAKQEDRITTVPYTDGALVNTYWDLGQSDLTSIWFIQKVGFEYHVIDYYQNSGHKFPHYAKLVKDKPYLYGKHWLPHDATHNQQAAMESIQAQAQRLLGSVGISPKLGRHKADGINAARSVFDRCLFDSEKCVDGISALRRYHFRTNEETGARSNEPVHDIFSHGSDSFMYFSMTITPPAKKKERKPAPKGGWQGKLHGKR